MFYLITVPPLLRKFYGDCLWEMPGNEKNIYFTFDDGPHPSITPFVLDWLKKFNAKATFFCIGKNVEAYPDVYRRIIEEGHAVGNHTYNHVNGNKVSAEAYMEEVRKASRFIDSSLFRPPYGRISRRQIKLLAESELKMRTVMWSVLSGDFDERLNANQCLNNIIKRLKPGSVVVFHDSEKAWKRMSGSLPVLLEKYTTLGYNFSSI